MAGLTVVYALSPIDLIPDFILLIGFLDDAILLPGLVVLTTRLIPDYIWEEHRLLAKDLWKDGKPKRWYYALPIILIWALLLIWLIRLFVH